MKPKLLIVELWGLGDLVIATPFIRAATQKYDVTLVAKPFAQALKERFWPEVRVSGFVAPWTAFKGKYWLHRWPWGELAQLRHTLAAEKFDLGLSARWDPRDHFLLWMAGARERMGYPRVQSQWFLTQPLERPAPRQHRYEYWRTLGRALHLPMPSPEEIPLGIARPHGAVLIHSGAAQAVRVWPLEKFNHLVSRLRAQGEKVAVACDADQRAWWLHAGEATVATPANVSELLALLDHAAIFVGNDSGPGHLAAFCGVPTVSLFGPQLTEWFSPLHPRTRAIEGKACPYKPCSDYCRFAQPHCLQLVGEDEVWDQLQGLLREARRQVA